MTIKSDISDMTISVPVKQFAHVLSLATNYAEIVKHLRETEAKLVRMRHELTNYQAKLTRIKELNRASGAGASVEPQNNETNAAGETDAVSLTIETTGRDVGGERAGLDGEEVKE